MCREWAAPDTQLPVRRCGAARWPNRHQGGGAKKHLLMPRAGSTVARICRRVASGERDPDVGVLGSRS